MASPPRAARELEAVAGQALSASGLRSAALDPLQRLAGAGPVFIASADPVTWLFTGATNTEIPASATRQFMANEFATPDVVKFRDLAAGASCVESMYHATAGEPATSARWRDVLEPLGWGDELRVALRDRAGTFGFICLHRGLDEQPFSADDVARVSAALPSLTRSFREAAAKPTAAHGSLPLGPGVVLLSDDLEIVGTTGSAAAWLAELNDPAEGYPLPMSVVGLAASVHGTQESATLTCRVHGRWLSLHASLLDGAGPERVAVVIEVAGPVSMLPAFAASIALTPRETDVTGAVLRGESTRGMARDLRISELTVQTHLKSIFAKAEVNSRAELVGRAFAQH
jgi:DNA-binding CsgD family transcriptional regulator